MKIDSRFISTPIEVFALLVIYGVDITLNNCGAEHSGHERERLPSLERL